MRLKLLIFSYLIAFLFSCQEREVIRPNIVFILADDLGYGELGSYGQELIETPNIDRLRSSGMKFTQFYAPAPVCAPTRAMLLSGLHAGHAYIRSNDEWAERGEVWNYVKASADPRLEGQRPIPANTQSIAKILQQSGYETALIGKWGLGAPFTEGIPNKQGFDYFYGYNCQRQAHNLYPGHLWENENKVQLSNQLVAPGTKLPAEANPLAASSYTLYQQTDYAPTLMQEKVLDFIRKEREDPFFLYYASPLPHVPLQAPDSLVQYYVQKFGDEKPYLGQRGYFPNRYPNATYAAMITYLDQQVGELISTLKKEGVYEKTLIVFTSDNGPTYAGGVDPEYFNSAGQFPNPYGRTKGFTYEGGIRVPMIASWPGHIEANSSSDYIGSFYDFFPTFAELARSAMPYQSDGISLLPTFKNDGVQTKHDYLYWEFPSYNGQQAVRMGKWKGLRMNMNDGNLAIELYDLSNDPQEQKNLAKEYPEIVEQIEHIMLAAHTAPENPKFNLPIDK